MYTRSSWRESADCFYLPLFKNINMEELQTIPPEIWSKVLQFLDTRWATLLYTN